ncbi:MAG: SPOR domain-containing protein [Steroidobacterales bacterium]
MAKTKFILGLVCAIAIGLAGCSREQSDWEKARASNSADSYESFVKKYPNGSFAPQAQQRLKELYEERDWQKARDADTPDSYQSFLKQYPEGKMAEEARIRVENFNLAQTPAGTPTTTGAPPAAAKAPAPASAATAPVAAPAAAKSAAAKAGESTAGSYGVQLGAFTSGQKTAERHWAALTKKYPSVLQGLTPKVRKTKSGKGHLYHLEVAGLTRANAGSICKQLKAKGASCIVLKPVHAKHKAKPHTRKK